MPTTRPDSLPDRVRLALDVGRDLFHAAVRLWVDEGNTLEDLALFFEYREGGYVRVRPAHRRTLAEFASAEIAAEMRRGRGESTPLFFKPHHAEIARGRLVWIDVRLTEG